MSLSNDLFELIKSLTKSEKRYFKLTVSPQKGEKNYLRLFDAMDRQEEYDEEALRREFAGEAFIRQFHVTKSYLYELILKSLRAYHDEFSADARLNNLLQKTDILHRKGLHDQARKLLAKGRTIAEEHHKYHRLLEILEIETSLGSRVITAEMAEETFGKEMELIGRLTTVARYRRLMDLLMARVVNQGIPRNEEEHGNISEIMDDPILQEDAEQLPLTARRLHHSIFASYYYSRSDFERALIHSRKQIALFEENPAVLEEMMSYYVAELNNLLISLEQCGYDEEFLETLAKLKRIAASTSGNPLRHQRVQARAFNLYSGLELSFYLGHGDFEKCRKLMDEIEQGLARFGSYIAKADILRFYYLFAQINLILGNPRDALRYVNIVLAYERTPKRRMIYNTARVVNLLIHYELGNMDLLEYQIKSTYRFLKKEASLYKVEQALLRFLQKVLGLKNPRGLMALFRDLRTELATLADDPFEKPIFQYFDYISWLDSKIERKTYRKILEEKGRVPR